MEAKKQWDYGDKTCLILQINYILYYFIVNLDKT